MKYLFLAALMTGFSAAAMAQDGSKADVDAVKRIISSKPADLDKQMKPFLKANKKNADNLVAFGRAFYDAKDTANAKVYANQALQVTKYKSAPAYVLLGDIEALSDNGGAAAAMYDQAINADPQNPDAYYKYALVYRKIDPRGAARKLDDLRTARPDISVDAIKGHIFMIAGDEKAAYNEFKKVPVAQMDRNYLNEFARASYFNGHFDDALAACQQGLKHKPRNATFTRLAMFSNYELKNYDEAKRYIHRYFNETDSAKFSEYDHFYAARIYEALNDKDNAYQQYDKALELVNDSSMIKRWDILKTLSDSHMKEKNFDKAIQHYQDMLASKKELTFDDEEGLATLYNKYADHTEDAAQKADLIRKADEIYGQVAQKYPIQETYATYMRANLNNKLDNNMEKSLAKPYYEKIVSLIGDKQGRSKGEDTMLKTSYHYLMFNSYINKNVPGAKEYAEKILAIDPEYKAALEIQNLK